MSNLPLPIFTFDIETYINCFLFSGKFLGDDRVYTFEISEFKNQQAELLQFLNWLMKLRPQRTVCKSINGVLMCGFNNLGFDYPVIHELIGNPHGFSYKKAYDMAQDIINAQKNKFTRGNRRMIWQTERFLDQLDLFLLHHFDNKAKTSNLKNIEFVMRSWLVADLPFSPHKPLTPEQILKLIEYNIHDVRECEKFLVLSMPQIQMRIDFLDEKIMWGDVLNYNDTKIGKEYLAQQLGKSVTHTQVRGRDGKMKSEKKQTFRSRVDFIEVLLPDLQFATEACQSVLDWYKSVTVYPSNKKDKKDKKKLQKKIKFYGIEYVFGLGGAHGAVKKKYHESNDEYIIVDVDVEAYYPSAAIKHGWNPEHLGTPFVQYYKDLKARRIQYPKESAMNKILKLALNGVFGDSNNVFSIYYDPKFLYSITINCQMLILKLVEDFCLTIPDIEIIQANTDGVTARLPRRYLEFFEMVMTSWQTQTGLKLERVNYNRMWTRDVNNYLAISDKGKVKRKGAYWYPEKPSDLEGNWHKDLSAVVIQKAAEKVMVEGYSPEFAVAMFTDPFDYMMKYKTTGDSRVYIGDKEMFKTTRYYVSTAGEPMTKFTPVKEEQKGQFKRSNSLTDEFFEMIMEENLETYGAYVWDARIHTGTKSMYEDKEDAIEKGFLAKECYNAKDFNANDIDYSYYVKKVNDLVIR